MKERLQILKEKNRFQWGELAHHLGISRSMLDQLRKGTRHPGPKLIRIIEAAEVEAGIVNSTRGVNYSSKTPAKSGISGSGNSIIWKNRVLGELSGIREEMAKWGEQITARIEALEKELKESQDG